MSAGARSEPTSFDPGPPPLLLVHREAVAHIHAAEYDVIESGIARSCRELAGPHPYLGLQAISGEPDVWFLNGFASVADQEEVGRRYRTNGPLMTALAEGSRRKSGSSESTWPAPRVLSARAERSRRLDARPRPLPRRLDG